MRICPRQKKIQLLDEYIHYTRESNLITYEDDEDDALAT